MLCAKPVEAGCGRRKIARGTAPFSSSSFELFIFRTWRNYTLVTAPNPQHDLEEVSRSLARRGVPGCRAGTEKRKRKFASQQQQHLSRRKRSASFLSFSDGAATPRGVLLLSSLLKVKIMPARRIISTLPRRIYLSAVSILRPLTRIQMQRKVVLALRVLSFE